jgi:hypothetical protein
MINHEAMKRGKDQPVAPELFTSSLTPTATLTAQGSGRLRELHEQLGSSVHKIEAISLFQVSWFPAHPVLSACGGASSGFLQNYRLSASISGFLSGSSKPREIPLVNVIARNRPVPDWSMHVT